MKGNGTRQQQQQQQQQVYSGINNNYAHQGTLISTVTIKVKTQKINHFTIMRSSEKWTILADLWTIKPGR